VTPKEKAEATWQKVSRLETLLQQKETQNKNLQENFDDAVKINKEYRGNRKANKQTIKELRSTISRLEGEHEIKLEECRETILELTKNIGLAKSEASRLEEEQYNTQNAVNQLRKLIASLTPPTGEQG